MSSDTISRLGLATLAILVFKVYFSSAACPDECEYTEQNKIWDADNIISVKCPKYSVHTFDIEPSCNVTIIANRHTRRCVNLFRVRVIVNCTELAKHMSSFFVYLISDWQKIYLLSHFQPTGGCTDLLMLCDGTNFMLPNKDPHLCRKGDVMFVKPDNHKPRAYCNDEYPVFNYPAMSHTSHGTGNLKVWFRGRNIMAPSRYAMCTVYCHSGTYLS